MNKILKLVAVLLALLVTVSCGTAEKKDDSITLAPKGEALSGNLKISAYDTMAYGELLKESAKQFMEKHPDTNIEIETFSAMPEMKTMEDNDGGTMAMSLMEDNPEARKDYLTRVNTQLMSGGGADIYALDVISLDGYIQNGQVENLTPYMEQDSEYKKEDIQNNVLEAGKIDGKNYFWPLTYDFSYISYNKDILSDAEAAFLKKPSVSLKDIIEHKGEKPVTEKDAKLINWSKAQLVHTLIMDRYKDFIDHGSKTASFTNGDFVKLLEETSALETDGYISPDRFDQLESMEERIEFFEKAETEEYKYAQNTSMEIIQKYMLDDRFAFSSTSNGYVEKDYQFGALKGNASGEILGSAYQSLMINRSSQNKALAWEFLKFLHSEEVQSSPSLSFMGLPMNNVSRKNYFHAFLTGRLFGSPIESTPEIEEDIENLWEEAEKYSNLIDVISQENPAIEEMISEGLQEYFSGKKTAEKTAEYLQSKLTLYLNE